MNRKSSRSVSKKSGLAPGTLVHIGADHGYDWAGSVIENGSVRDPALRQQIMSMRSDPQLSALMAGELANDNRNYLFGVLGRQTEHIADPWSWGSLIRRLTLDAPVNEVVNSPLGQRYLANRKMPLRKLRIPSATWKMPFGKFRSPSATRKVPFRKFRPLPAIRKVSFGEFRPPSAFR